MSQGYRPVSQDPWADFYNRQAVEIVPEHTPLGLPNGYYEHNSPDMGQPGHPPNVQLLSKSEVDRQTRALLMEQGVVPVRSSGTRGFASMDQAALMADIEYAFAKNLIGYALAENPDLGGTNPATGEPNNPLGESPVIKPPPVGGCIAVAELRFGHEGSNQTVLFDLPPGAVVKVPLAGSSAKLFGRLLPKYFKNNDNTLVARKRVYLITPTSPIAMTNAQYNMMPGVLTANGFTNTGLAPFQGFFAEGSVANGDQFSKPTRRFYGSVKGAGAAPFQNTLCPVAWNAVAMQVTGGLGPLIDPATGVLSASVPLQFNQNGPPGSFQAGPYPMNTIVPLLDNCQSIEVFQSAAGAGDIPFEVVYYLSF